MALTTYGEQQLLSIFSGNSPFPPGGFCLGLFTTQPDASGNGTEVSGGGYARQGVSMGNAQGSAPVTISNTAIVGWPTATAAWGNVVAVAIYDALTGGNMWAWAPLSTSQNVTGAAGASNFRIEVGALTLSLN